MTLSVHVCEEGNGARIWHINGPFYAGGLGWLIATWTAFRLTVDVLRELRNAARTGQAMTRFVRLVLGGHWPDQHGCTGGY